MNPIVASELNTFTEETSIRTIQALQEEAIATPLSPEPIVTSYLHEGNDGTPIVLLPGFDSSVLEFRRLLPLLAEHQETWAIDLFGFGFTERRPNLPVNPEAIKVHLHSVWQTLIQKPMILVGVSMGGATAIDFSLSYPEAVEQLVLIDSAGFANGQAITAQWLKPLVYGAAKFLRQSWVRQSVAVQAYYDRKWASVDARLCGALHLKMPYWTEAMVSFTLSGGYNNMADKVGKVTHPTLILWGEGDRILGTADAAKFQKAIPQAKLIWIEQSGHTPHLEQPQKTAELILEHCSQPSLRLR